MASSKIQSPVDTGWAWMILIATVIDFALNALIYTTGIFNVVFLELFDESRSVTAWCGALHSGLSNLLGVGISLVYRYWGPRKTIGFGALCIFLGFVSTFFAKTFIHVFVTYGIVVGIGFAFTIIPVNIILGFYFNKYRNIAYGIANASVGVGNATFALLIQYLLDTYGMNGTILITGAISSHMFIVAALCRPFNLNANLEEFENVKEDKTDKQGSTDVHSKEMSKTLHPNAAQLKSTGSSLLYHTSKLSCHSLYSECRSHVREDKKPQRDFSKLLSYSFLAWCTNLLLVVAAISCVYLHFPAYAVSMGTTPDKVALLVMVMGLGNMAIRLLFGFATYNSEICTFIAYVGSGLVASIILFAGPYMSKSYVGQVFFAGLFSAFGNGYSGLMGPLVIDMLGLEIFDIAYGIGLTLCGVGFIIGPPIAGALYDYTGSYFYTFIMSGSCYLVAGLVMLPIPWLKKQT